MGLDIYTWAGWAGWVGQLTEGIDRGTDGRSNALRAAPGASPPPPPHLLPPGGGWDTEKRTAKFSRHFLGHATDSWHSDGSQMACTKGQQPKRHALKRGARCARPPKWHPIGMRFKGNLKGIYHPSPTSRFLNMAQLYSFSPK